MPYHYIFEQDNQMAYYSIQVSISYNVTNIYSERAHAQAKILTVNIVCIEVTGHYNRRQINEATNERMKGNGMKRKIETTKHLFEHLII